MAIINAIDLGNSRAKMLSRGNVFVSEYADSWYEDLLMKSLCEPGGECVFSVSSVNIPRFEQLTELLHKSDIPFFNANEIIHDFAEIDFSDIHGMGIDRKYGLIGAYSVVKPPFVVIDCGTAITINPLTRDKKALGGVILPGIETQARSLADFTDLLPYVQIHHTDKYFGQSTVEAINCGIYQSVCGGVLSILRGISETHFDGEIPKVLITGGQGQLLQKGLPIKSVYNPDLVLFGIEKVAMQSVHLF